MGCFSFVVAGAGAQIELVHELDNRWTNGWTAPPNRLAGLTYRNPRQFKTFLFAVGLVVGQGLDMETVRLYHE